MPTIQTVPIQDLHSLLEKNEPFPAVVIYWDPEDDRYAEYVNRAEALTSASDERLSVFAVEMKAFELRYHGRQYFANVCPLFGHGRAELPMLQVVARKEQIYYDTNDRPGFVSGWTNFVPAMPHMFKLAEQAIS